MPHIQLETVTTCNAKCGFCPYPTLGRKGDIMSMELFRKIIDEVQELPLIQYIYMVGLGETLLDPHLLDRARYIRSRGMKNFIGIFTNGFLATEARIDALYDAGINMIHFSLNANSEEEHTKAMGVKGAYPKVVKAVEYALRTSGPGRLAQPCAVGVAGFDSIQFRKTWGPAGQMWREDNFAGCTSAGTPPLPVCDFPQTQINVLWDGRVSACCMDVAGKRVFGDLSAQSIKEVFNSEAFTRFRWLHHIGRGKVENPCRNCSRI